MVFKVERLNAKTTLVSKLSDIKFYETFCCLQNSNNYGLP